MQQRLLSGLDVEIAGLQQQRDIGGKGRAGKNVRAQPCIGRWQHPQPAQHQHRAQHHDQRRENPPDTPAIEIGQAEPFPGEVARDQAADQEARNYEEDVDADETARDGLRKGVKIHHQQHGDGAQAVDIGPISGLRQGGHRPDRERGLRESRRHRLTGLAGAAIARKKPSGQEKESARIALFQACGIGFRRP